MSGTPVITVFGGSGFLGRNLLRHLRSLPLPPGTTVRLASRTPHFPTPPPPSSSSSGSTSTGASSPPPRLLMTPVRCDLTSRADLRAALSGATHVVNLVGILHETRPKSTFQALQADAPAKLADVIATAPVPPQSIVHVSAIGADAASPSVYAQTKAAGEAAVSALATDHGIPVSILRPSIVFGPDDAFFNQFARIARFSPFLPLVGGGHTRFQPVHVRDVAQAIAVKLGLEETLSTPAEPPVTESPASASSQDASSEDASAAKLAPSIYELGGADVLTFRQLMELLLSVTKQQRLLLPLPYQAATVQGRLFEAVHSAVPALRPLLTADQVKLLRRDNVVTTGMAGLSDLGIVPQSCNTETISYAAATARGETPNVET